MQSVFLLMQEPYNYCDIWIRLQAWYIMQAPSMLYLLFNLTLKLVWFSDYPRRETKAIIWSDATFI